MTTQQTTVTDTLTEQEIAHRKACDYLKGLIMGTSGEESKRKGSPEFDQGCEDSTKFASNSFTHYDPTCNHYHFLTAIHILHNGLRHSRPHTGSIERDLAILQSAKSSYYIGKRISDLIDMATNAKEA